MPCNRSLERGVLKIVLGMQRMEELIAGNEQTRREKEVVMEGSFEEGPLGVGMGGGRWQLLPQRFWLCLIALNMHGRLKGRFPQYCLDKAWNPNVICTIRSHFLRGKNSNEKEETQK